MKKIIALTIILMVSACATATYEYGKDFSEADVESIQKGTTTQSEISTKFGKPSTTIVNADDTVIWVYTYMNSTAHAQNKIFSMDVTSTVLNKILKVHFKAGIVTNYEFSNSGGPGTIKSKVY